MDNGPFAVASLPELPGRDWMRVTPEPDPGSAGLHFNLGKVPVPGVSLEVPCETRLEELFVETTVPHIYPGDEPAVAIPVHGADLHLLAESKNGCELMGTVAVCLMFLGAVDAVEADLDRLAVLEDGKGVPVCNPADPSVPPVSRGCKEERKAQNRQDQPMISLHSFVIG